MKKWTYTLTHDHRFSIRNESNLSIAVTHNQDEESKKAARLIAAAPELLEALEETVMELHGAIYNRALQTWATEDVAYKHADGLVEKYKNLIAKAKGEA